MTGPSSSDRVEAALFVLAQGIPDGDHHKAWVIDQVVRTLTGCPLVEDTGNDWKGRPYTYVRLGESDEYRAWVTAYEDGEDGPETYTWDEGIAP